MLDGNIILSVAKAMELLQLLNQAAKPMPLTELVQKSGYPKSTVFGLLATMRAYDVVTQTADGKYALGLRLFEFGRQCGTCCVGHFDRGAALYGTAGTAGQCVRDAVNL